MSKHQEVTAYMFAPEDFFKLQREVLEMASRAIEEFEKELPDEGQLRAARAHILAIEAGHPDEDTLRRTANTNFRYTNTGRYPSRLQQVAKMLLSVSRIPPWLHEPGELEWRLQDAKYMLSMAQNKVRHITPCPSQSLRFPRVHLGSELASQVAKLMEGAETS